MACLMLDHLRQLPSDSFDSCVTKVRVDPLIEPCTTDILAYIQTGRLEGLPSLDLWKECYRVLKPGAHAAISAEAQLWDLVALGLRMAGFQNRDTIAVLSAQLWEPVFLLRKPLGEKTVTENVIKHGTGALGIDGCRVMSAEPNPSIQRRATTGTAPISGRKAAEAEASGRIERRGSAEVYMAERSSEALGRWPPNTVTIHHSGCKLVGTKNVRSHNPGNNDNVRLQRTTYSGGKCGVRSLTEHARDGIETVEAWDCEGGCPVKALDAQGESISRFYPQFKVKGDVRDWVTRLITPSGGRVLDPFP